MGTARSGLASMLTTIWTVMMLCGSRSAALTRTSLVAPTTRTTGVLIELVSMGAADDLVSATAEIGGLVKSFLSARRQPRGIVAPSVIVLNAVCSHQLYNLSMHLYSTYLCVQLVQACTVQACTALYIQG